MLFYTLTLDEAQKTKFEQIYIKYKQLMVYAAYEVLEDEMAVEDVVHSALLKISACLDKIDLENHIKTKVFLTTIVKNYCIDMLRKRQKKQILSWNELEEWQHVSVDTDLLRALPEEPRVLTIIENMPPLYKEVFVLKYVNDLSDSEIGQMLGIKEDSVRKRVYRGKKILEQALKGVMRDEF